jgi:hypothetical protein
MLASTIAVRLARIVLPGLTLRGKGRENPVTPDPL